MFFTSGGSEAVETAIKVARQYHKLTGNPNKTKLIAREVAYHGTTLGGARGRRGSRPAHPFEPLVPGAGRFPSPTPTCYRSHRYAPRTSRRRSAHRIDFEGPDTVAAVIIEPVQNAGGCFVPPDGYSIACARSATSSTCC